MFDYGADLQKAYDEGYKKGKADAVRHGRWLKDVEGCLFCSNCQNTAEFNPLSMEQFKTPYCNVCGAKMDGGDTDA